MTTLVVVPSAYHVERCARSGIRAETRTSLCAKLLRALLPDTAFSNAHECRLVLGMALSASREGLDLVASMATDRPGQAGERARHLLPEDDPTVSAMRVRGGTAWVRLVASLDHALGELRRRGVEVTWLDEVAKGGRSAAAERARMMSFAMRSLDMWLSACGTTDARLAPWLLARAIPRVVATGEVKALSEVVGARHVRSRWILSWQPSDLAWFRALDEALSQERGSARVVLASLERPLEATRELDPFERIADDVARSLDGPPEIEPVAGRLGDLSSGAMPPEDIARLRVIATSDASAQATQAARIVEEALLGHTPLERIVIALPGTLATSSPTVSLLEQALEERQIVVASRPASKPSESLLVDALFAMLSAGKRLERMHIARVASSGFIDAARCAPEGTDPQKARAALGHAARKLRASPTAQGSDALARIVRTAAPEGGLQAQVISKLCAELAKAAAAVSRGERVASLRELTSALGVAVAASRGGLAAFASDSSPLGVVRAERAAIVESSRAWDAVVGALDVYESTARKLGALDHPVDDDMFRAELCELADAELAVPAGPRIGAVRIASLSELPGNALDLLVVVDANDESLPSSKAATSLVPAALEQELMRIRGGQFSPVDEHLERARQLAALGLAGSEAERIVLLFSRENSTGEAVGASSIVEQLARHGVPIESARATEARPLSTSARLRARREKMREAFFLDPTRALSDVVGKLNSTPLVQSVLRRETGGDERPLGVTSLEHFAQCAFQGFARSVLLAREADIREEIPDPREEGIAVHEALAAAFSATANLWQERPRQAQVIRERAMRAVDSWQAEHDAHAPLRAVSRMRVRAAVRASVDSAIADERWDFALAEQSFGAPRKLRRGLNSKKESEQAQRRDWRSFEVAFEGHRLALRGSVDRVDMAHDKKSARVIDYKATANTVRKSLAGLGTNALQVPIYACVAARELGVPTTGAYVSTRPRDLSDRSHVTHCDRSERDVRELVDRVEPGLAAIERGAIALVRRVRDGALVPLPTESTMCETCPAQGGCRLPRFVVGARLEEPEEAE